MRAGAAAASGRAGTGDGGLRVSRRDWRDETLRKLHDRLASATAPADQGALLRDLLRVAEKEVRLPSREFHLDAVPWARFGLVGVRRGADWHVRADARFHPELPRELWNELSRVLPLDPLVRRPDEPAVADAVLRRLSPYPHYRNPTQKAAVRALLTMPEGGTLLATMATGTGKSLLFQLGALWWRERALGEDKPCAIVLVPTISLALNHRDAAAEFPGLEGSRALTGDTPEQERRETLLAFHQGTVPLLFISPEAALGRLREEFLQAALPPNDPARPLAAKGRLTTVFVDEVHIVASWGRSFRPDLQRIPGLVKALRARNPGLRTVLLSATVDDATLVLLRSQYGGTEAARVPWLEVAERMPRTEFDIVRHLFPEHMKREDAVVQLADVLPRPALIYTTEIEDAERLVYRLRTQRGYARVAVFTGNTRRVDRERIVEEWRHGALDLVVATSAFGMGIDHAGVRAVVHACLPEDASRYYQEIGRAGRDGYQAFALLLQAHGDFDRAQGLVSKTILGLDTMLPRWKALLASRRPTGADPVTGRLCFGMKLDTRSANIPSDQVTGEQHRRWNKSLLVQLQRYGALEVASSEDDAAEWLVVVGSRHRGIWDETQVDEVVKYLCAHDRQKEMSRALGALQSFADVWEQEEECCLEAVFHKVEAGSPPLDPCGRCPVCRHHGFEPVRQKHGGTHERWPAPVGHFPVTRLLRIERGTQVRRWLAHLHGKGVEQLIVPESMAVEVAEVWEDIGGTPGWVLTWNEVLARRGGFSPLEVSTAIVLLGISGREVDRAWAAREAWPHLLTWVVAFSGTRVDGRDLDEVASHRPPVVLGQEEEQ